MLTTPCALVKRTPGGTDSMGNDVDTETVTMTAGLFAPGSSAEIAYGQSDRVTTQPTEYLPADVDVSAFDVLVPDVLVDSAGNPVLDGNGKVQGTRYEVDGQPASWPANPFTGWRPALPVVVPLRRVTG